VFHVKSLNAGTSAVIDEVEVFQKAEFNKKLLFPICDYGSLKLFRRPVFYLGEQGVRSPYLIPDESVSQNSFGIRGPSSLTCNAKCNIGHHVEHNNCELIAAVHHVVASREVLHRHRKPT
jgi:hypothetical protein